MIRREQLGHEASDGGAPAEIMAAEAVKRGESVRIVGLGTLAPSSAACAHTPTSCAGGAAHHITYRLTLTTAVTKAFRTPDDTGIESDVRHIARALGAPVEVWAPATCKALGCVSECGPTLVAKVKP